MKDELYLANILSSINLIESYVKFKKLKDLAKSNLLKDAVSKQLEEVGENIKKVSSKLKKKYSEVEWEAFVETRNFLTHVYQLVNVKKLWMITKKDIPILKKQVEEILAREKE